MITVAAPAKINLYLHVTGQRGDGYHLVDSLIVFAAVSDLIWVADGDGLTVTIDGPFAGALQGADNLVTKAAKALADAAGVPADAAIRLTKSLPVAAGIGGGSADAAAALKALSELWKIAPGRADLAGVARALGADVPVCLGGGASFVGGIGGEIVPAPPLPPAWLVLANPGQALATAAVFAARDGAFSKAARFAEAPTDISALAELLAARSNDLTAPATELAPVIGEVIRALAARPGAKVPRMSGSGATCCALFEGETEARAAATALSADHPAWWIAAAAMG